MDAWSEKGWSSRSLAAHGSALERLDVLPCLWRVAIPPPRVLEIWFTGGDDPVVAAVSYRVGKPWGSKAQRRAAKLQSAFDERYEHLDPQGGVLSPDDRVILLVGELEADVNNGGFGQYLGNKGEARAREALACLSAIGAKRTGRWLAAALEAGADADGAWPSSCSGGDNCAQYCSRILAVRVVADGWGAVANTCTDSPSRR